MPGLDNTQLNSFQQAFYALDDKIQGDSGYTERQRAKFLIMHSCQISERCFFQWLKYPKKVTITNRYFISVVLNKNPQIIFLRHD